MSRRTRVSAGVVFVLGACASPGIPPGGPPDKLPPALVSVAPDTNSVNVRARAVLFRFDEVVSERSTPIASAGGGGGGSAFGGGAGGGTGFGGGSNVSSLASLVSVSPGDGRERVSWRRDAIEIEPRNGFRPNTTYRVTILPGLADLRGNILRERVEVVFSTGAQPTTGSVSGLVFDWVGNKAAPGARVEVFARADTALRWSTRADSTGRFVVRDLAPGTYSLRGWLDANANRAIDPRELFDSTTVSVDTAAAADLYAFAHDTIGPRLESLEPVDSTALRMKFDRGVDVTWNPDRTTLVIMRSDSSVVPIGIMMPAARFDSLAQAARDKADSAAALKDSAAITSPEATPAPVSAAAPRAAAPPPAAQRARALPGRPGPPADTVPPPKLDRPIPIQSWVVRFDAPLPPGDYRLKVRGIRGLTGAKRDSEREFKLRPPPAPRDSTTPPTAGAVKPAAGTVPARPPAPSAPDVRRPRR